MEPINPALSDGTEGWLVDALFEAMDAGEGVASVLPRSHVLVPYSSTERTVAL